MIKLKIKKIFLKKKINSNYLIFNFSIFKKEIIIKKNFFYLLIIFFNFVKKIYFLKKNLSIFLNICGSGGDGINLPNISTSDCIVWSFFLKKILKNSGNSILLKNGSLNFLKKIKILDYIYLSNNNNFINNKNMSNYFFSFRKKLRKNSYFNTCNPIVNIFVNKINAIGTYSKKNFFLIKFLIFNSFVFFNNSDDIIQNNQIVFIKKNKYYINNLQLNLHNLFFNKSIFTENFKFLIFNIKHKKNNFFLSKLFLTLFLLKFKKFSFIYFFLYIVYNNYLYKFLKNKIQL
ncbi:hypothetical protein [Candidatus Carsonella ruddii]|uniref:Anthranilate phosphoribosyltransferase n=1 Tax=Candidatus Carsonella ruddii (Diaphorina cf. continua) TaxID=2661587 RepID=A0A7R7ABH0_CARRU|nr:hypothetical protein [Candidatus Carsonella ruddii (Diaphorina cf. continua)]BCG49263.1 anthranilate phosphoribosyltransferase [Candidatus Carsonella ruddii (Diaphorina cf. continua)]